MLARTLTLFANVPLSVVGLLIFVCFFAIASVWILSVRPTRFYDNLAQMPLREDKEVGRESI